MAGREELHAHGKRKQQSECENYAAKQTSCRSNPTVAPWRDAAPSNGVRDPATPQSTKGNTMEPRPNEQLCRLETAALQWLENAHIEIQAMQDEIQAGVDGLLPQRSQVAQGCIRNAVDNIQVLRRR